MTSGGVFGWTPPPISDSGGDYLLAARMAGKIDADGYTIQEPVPTKTQDPEKTARLDLSEDEEDVGFMHKIPNTGSGSTASMMLE